MNLSSLLASARNCFRREQRRETVFIEVEKPRPGFSLTQGSVSSEEAQFINRLVERANQFSGPIIEIGALFGMTTVKLARWKATGKKLIAVDNFAWNPLGLSSAEHQELTSAILAYLCDIGEVEIRAIAKNEFYQSYSGTAPALVFLDAIHTYEETARDIEWAIKSKAAIVCGHDYSEEFTGVRQAVDQAGGPVELVGTVWVLPPAKQPSLSA